MSDEINEYHRTVARWLAQRPGPCSAFMLTANQASDLLDEWEDAQAMIEALQELVAVLQGVEAPPVWTVIA